MRGTSAMSIPVPTIMTPYVSTEQCRRRRPARAGRALLGGSPAMVFEVALRDEKPLAQISVPTSRAGHLHERGRSRLHEPHSLLAIVPDFRDNRHHECRYSRQKGSGKGDLAV